MREINLLPSTISDAGTQSTDLQNDSSVTSKFIPPEETSNCEHPDSVPHENS